MVRKLENHLNLVYEQGETETEETHCDTKFTSALEFFHGFLFGCRLEIDPFH